MIRTGYLRWEIDVTDARSEADQMAREVTLRARPSYRVVRVRNTQAREEAAARFVRGQAAYDDVLRSLERDDGTTDVTVPDVGPHVFRYTQEDRDRMPRFWMEKLGREISAFAFEVVRAASRFPQLVIANPALRLGYAKMVEREVQRVMSGQSAPEPTREGEPMRLDAQAFGVGVPELVAAELVRDVVEPREFDEFRLENRITIRNGGRIYRIPRQSHALIQVWNEKTLRGEAQLCVVFQDPGMPPSDEVVMKYLIIKHQPEMLWSIGVRFEAPKGRFETSRAWRR
jgi:hypothetical protein